MKGNLREGAWGHGPLPPPSDSLPQPHIFERGVAHRPYTGWEGAVGGGQGPQVPAPPPASSHHPFNNAAASLAKYVKIRSAPARLMASSDSSMAAVSSSQPWAAAALSILYSPLTW